ncbi:glycosyltransferase family 4 protein [Janibacter alittae]|uniref:Glycosyltransferase family 4 protein n=1 Tax=Janibacter alittae TaxID=3115209 RepID=A0ABZ2MLE4_9MICO
MRTVHVVLPGDIDDPLHPSGGNTYDREVCTGLAGLGWSVREHPVPGSWPHPQPETPAALAATLADVPDDSVVLLDGLVALAAPEETAAAGDRLRLVVLAHMVAADEAAERTALSAATAVITTSNWTRDRMLDRHGLPDARVHVAEPGVRPAEVTDGSGGGGHLLCVAPVTRAKGHDVLVEALASIRDLDWQCTCVGPLDVEPVFVRDLQERVAELGLADRVGFVGPRVGDDLDTAYVRADLLVHPTRADTYAMVVTEALVRGIPVIAARVGGVPATLGQVGGGLPGALVPPGDADALAAGLRAWLTDADHREGVRGAARGRRLTLTPWRETVTRVAQVLDEVADGPRGP